jgi:hypothetical protein
MTADEDSALDGHDGPGAERGGLLRRILALLVPIVVLVALMTVRVGSLSLAALLVVVLGEMAVLVVRFAASWTKTFHTAVERFDCADARLPRSSLAIIGIIVSTIVAGGALIMGALFVGVTVTDWCVNHVRFVSEQTRRNATSVLFPLGSAAFSHAVVSLGLRSRRIVRTLVTLRHPRDDALPDSTGL